MLLLRVLMQRRRGLLFVFLAFLLSAFAVIMGYQLFESIGYAEDIQAIRNQKEKEKADQKSGPATDDYLIKGPTLQRWHDLDQISPKENDLIKKPVASSSWPWVAVARYFKSDVFYSASSKSSEKGYVRRGAYLLVKKTVKGDGCKGGHWYLVQGGGYICSKKGFTVGKKAPTLDLHFSLPDPTHPLPYKYVKVINNNAPRFISMPSDADDKNIPAVLPEKGTWPSGVERPMTGIFFLAIHDQLASGKRQFLQTVYGRYARMDDTKPVTPSTMHGEFLDDKKKLPLAFVYGEDQTVFREVDGELQELGLVAKHARFVVEEILEHQGKPYVRGPEGIILPRSGVRVVEAIERPTEVPADEKWIHVNLSEQSLVAYEGNRPVFATLISSGKKGHEPPKGVFRIRMKHLTVTMDGEDPVDKWYEVEEVPWTMYYWEGYALHGAYWHNDFGTPRSHGCTNIAPADARWLFYWSAPALPQGWHGLRADGAWVKFTS